MSSLVISIIQLYGVSVDLVDHFRYVRAKEVTFWCEMGSVDAIVRSYDVTISKKKKLGF